MPTKLVNETRAEVLGEVAKMKKRSTVDKLKEWRSYFIVAAFVVAAVVTPPDVVSQLALAIPMCLLYELGILAARVVSRPAPQESPEYVMVDPAEEAKMDAEMDSAEEEFRKLSGK